MAFVSSSFSSRKVQGRRFTSDYYTDVQEAFTSTIDIQSFEVLTDDRYIPSSSLPYSGSSQHGLIVSRSYTDPSITPESGDDGNVLQYYYRHKLTRGNLPSSEDLEVYFFLRDEPSTATQAVSSNQLVSASQLTNFINNKNALGSLGAGDSENIGGNGLAYNIVVFKSTTNYSTPSTKESLTGGDIIDPSTYVFDYKTGILSFISSFPISTNFIYVTAYKYIGRTLDSQLRDGSLSGGGGTGAGFPFSGSAVITGSLSVSGSNVNFTLATGVSGAFSGSSCKAASHWANNSRSASVKHILLKHCLMFRRRRSFHSNAVSSKW